MIHNAAVLATSTDHIGTAIAHCEACGYQLYGIVQDWKAAYDLLQAGLVTVIVVGARDIWAPKIEYAERNQRSTTIGSSSNSRWRRARAVRRQR